MDQRDYSYEWRPAGRHELYLIKFWEKRWLKQRVLGVLYRMFKYSFLYWLLVFCTIFIREPVWKLMLVYLMLLLSILSLWVFSVHEDKQAVWGNKVFTRTVTCIGHTEFSTRYNRSFWLDIKGENGEILREIEIPQIIFESVKHQDKLLAVTGDPASLRPVRLVPLSQD